MSQVNSSKFISAKSATGRRQVADRLGAGLLSAGVLGVGLLCGCGGEDDDARRNLRDETANLQATGGTSGDMGQAGAAGMPAAPPAAAPAAPVDPEAPSGMAQSCTAMAAPEVLVDLSMYTAAGAWGDAARSQITGGTSLYSLAPNPNLVNTLTDGVLHLVGPIPASAYAGIVLWFGPCVDASAY